jgi:hypothetical protein
MSLISGGPGKAVWWDKIASRFDGWNDARFREAGLRAVPNCVVRRSAYIASGQCSRRIVQSALDRQVFFRSLGCKLLLGPLLAQMF